MSYPERSRIPIAGAAALAVSPAQCDAGWSQAFRVDSKVTLIACSIRPALTSS
jgi:hypothetical protein